MASQTFSSPTMRARSSLVRGLALVDEVERAWARRDWTAVARLADAIRTELVLVRDAAESMAPAEPRPDGSTPALATAPCWCIGPWRHLAVVDRPDTVLALEHLSGGAGCLYSWRAAGSELESRAAWGDK